MGSFKNYAGFIKKGMFHMSGGRYSYGRITKCVIARVYTDPTVQSRIVGTVPRGTELMIVDGFGPDDYFYSVITADGLRGYCMRVFVEVVQRTRPKQDASEEA